MLKRCHTNTTAKTWVAYGNSHLVGDSGLLWLYSFKVTALFFLEGGWGLFVCVLGGGGAGLLKLSLWLLWDSWRETGFWKIALPYQLCIASTFDSFVYLFVLSADWVSALFTFRYWWRFGFWHHPREWGTQRDMHAEEQGEIRDHLQVSARCSPAAGLNCGMIRAFACGLFVYWVLLSALCRQFLQHVKCVK